MKASSSPAAPPAACLSLQHLGKGQGIPRRHVVPRVAARPADHGALKQAGPHQDVAPPVDQHRQAALVEEDGQPRHRILIIQLHRAGRTRRAISPCYYGTSQRYPAGTALIAPGDFFYQHQHQQLGQQATHHRP